MRHDWPGNIRELENFVERSWFLPTASMAEQTVASATFSIDEPQTRLADALAATERACLERALRDAASTYAIAARLGISQASVVRKLKKHGLAPPGRPG